MHNNDILTMLRADFICVYFLITTQTAGFLSAGDKRTFYYTCNSLSVSNRPEAQGDINRFHTHYKNDITPEKTECILLPDFNCSNTARSGYFLGIWAYDIHHIPN